MIVKPKPLFLKRVLEQHLAQLKRQDIRPPEGKIAIIQTWQEKVTSGHLNRYTETQTEQAFNNAIFGEILGYEPMSSPNSVHHIVPKRSAISRDIPDFVLGMFNPGSNTERWRVVGEIKAVDVNLDLPQTSRFNRETPVEQAFRYALNGRPGVEWIIVTNFSEIRLYRNGYAATYQAWKIDDLIQPDEFFEFWAVLRQPSLCPEFGSSSTLALFDKSVSAGASLTEGFYGLYDLARTTLALELKRQPSCASLSRLAIQGKAHKLLNRALFAAFCEDHAAELLPPNTLYRIYHEARADSGQNRYWRHFHRFFGELDRGSPPGSKNGFHAFNGGLFAPDSILDNLNLPDGLFTRKFKYQSGRGISSREIEGIFGFYVYDFSEELDVDSLGAIFEQSLKDIMSDGAVRGAGTTDVSSREKGGVYYTPEAITAILVSRSLNALLDPLRNDMVSRLKGAQVKRSQFKFAKKSLTAEQSRELLFLEEQAKALEQISLQDPACGSGAFLVEGYRQLWSEYTSLNAAVSRISGAQPLFGLNKVILSNNLHGTDVLQESVEITRLSLWLRTASRTEPLEKLDRTIVCGDSLVDKRQGVFDILVSNPPWGATLEGWDSQEIAEAFPDAGSEKDSYAIFTIIGESLLKQGGILAFILPNSWLTVRSYSIFRRWLISHFHVMEIIHVWKVFKDVNHDACLLVARKRSVPKTPSDGEVTMIRRISRGIKEESKWQRIAEERWESSFSAEPAAWAEEPDARFETIYSPNLVGALNRGFRKSRPLGDIADVTVGIQVYHHTLVSKEDIKKRIFHSRTKDGPKWLSFLTGNEVQRYFEAPANDEYLLYSSQLCDKRPLPHYSEPRILIQQIFWNRLSASLSPKADTPTLYLNTLFSVSRPKPPYSLESIIAILNSRLISASYERFANRIFGDKFPKVSKLDLARLPIPILTRASLKQLAVAGSELSDLWRSLRRTLTGFRESCYSADSSGDLWLKLGSFWLADRMFIIKHLSSGGHVPGIARDAFVGEWEQARNAVQRTWSEITSREESIESTLRLAMNFSQDTYDEILARVPEAKIEDALLPR